LGEHEKATDPTCQELIPVLEEIQANLEEFFLFFEINCQERVTSIENINDLNVKAKNQKGMELINKILSSTNEISSIKMLINYREFGEIINSTIPLIKSLLSLQGTNISQFHRESYRLLKYFWAIRYVIARFELESIPQYIKNQVIFFNLPDVLFEFFETLKEGPQLVEILAEVDLAVRIHKGLPLMISRGVDEITLSDLGKKLFKVHSISEYYFYYLYDFEEEVLSLP